MKDKTIKTIFLFIFAISSIAGCGSQQVKSSPEAKPKYIFFYNHPDFGKVVLPDDRYAKDRNTCENQAYSSGVMIDGTLTYDRKIIKKYDMKLVLWIFNNIKKEEFERFDELIPKRYEGVNKASKVLVKCLNDLGWGKKQKQARIEIEQLD